MEYDLETLRHHLACELVEWRDGGAPPEAVVDAIEELVKRLLKGELE